MIHREHILQRHLREWVRDAVADDHEFFSFDRRAPTGRFTHLREMSRGIRRATPDTLLRISALSPIWCELKAPGKRPSDEQIIMGTRLMELSDRWTWTTTVTGYCAYLKRCGVTLRPNAEFLAQHHDAEILGTTERAELKAGKVPKRLKARIVPPTPAKVRRARKAGVIA